MITNTRKFFDQAVVRRFFSCIFLGIVAALITDSDEGSSDHPLQAAKTAVFSTRSLKWFVLAILLWAVWTYGGAIRGQTTALVSKLSLANPLAGRRESRWVLYAGLLAVAIIGPRLLPAYLQIVMFSAVGIYALLALGLNVVVGYAGLLDLGFIAFFAIGAYVTAYFTKSTESPTFI